MRIVRVVALMACCLALTGCSLFGRKPAASTGGARPAGEALPAPVPPVAARPPEPAGAENGLLAGQIMDGFNHRPGGAFIQVSLVRQGSEPTAAPIEVAADNQGYFTIQGLQVGRHYQLVARSQDGAHKLAGVVWATPPNPRVVIRVNEDNVSPTTPDLPAAPWPATRPQPPAPNWPDDKDHAWTPQGGASRPADLGTPVKTDDANNAPKPNAAVSPERTAEGPLARNRLDPPVAIPNQSPTFPKPIDDPSPAPPVAALPSVPAPVPSCALTGQTLANFALNDLDGRPWEFRQHPARLTLIDFWGSWCMPCRNAIPHLKILQDNYRSYGLSVVGVAYEYEGSVPEQVQRINSIRARYGINYQVLLGGDMRSCPVRTQFNVRSFPTLVLVDDSGRILWRGQGLDQQRLAELDLLIRQRLLVR